GQRCQQLLDTGVVEGKIKPAECRHGPFDHRFDIARFRDVGFDEDRFAAQGLDLGDDSIAFFLSASTDNDLGALFRKLNCGGTANTGITASDQCDFSYKLTHRMLLHIDFPPLVFVTCHSYPFIVVFLTESLSISGLTTISVSVRA